jgi:hypothetical protein
MKAFTLVCTSLAMAISGIAHGAEIDISHIQRLGPVIQLTATPLSKSAHADALRANLISNLVDKLAANVVEGSGLKKSNSIQVFNQQLTWQAASSTVEGEGWLAYQLPVSTHRFTQGTLTVKGLDNPQVYVNGQLVKSANEVTLNLTNGDYQVLVLADGLQKEVPFSLDWQGKSDVDQLDFTQQKSQRVSAQQLFDAKVINSLTLSPNGKYLLQSTIEYQASQGDTAIEVTELRKVSDNSVMYRWQDNRPSSAVWSGDSKQLAFVANKQIQLLNVAELTIQVVASDIDNVSGLHW